MEQSGYSLVLKEVSLIDIEEIKVDVPTSDLEVVQPSKNAQSHNELATILIIALTTQALTALSVWLLRTYSGEVVDYKVTTRTPDGSEKDVHLKIKRSSSEAPKAQVIKQVAAALQFPEDIIAKASD